MSSNIPNVNYFICSNCQKEYHENPRHVDLASGKTFCSKCWERPSPLDVTGYISDRLEQTGKRDFP